MRRTPLWRRARTLIDSKQPQAAFDLLDPLEETRAGDPAFDYLLGQAAIDAGKLTRGVFALERVLAVQPDNAVARAEIARAYFLMGENRAAKEEFEAVRAANPPAAVTSTINQFLDALQARESVRNTTGLSGYLEVGYGYDTNANAATTTGSFAIRLWRLGVQPECRRPKDPCLVPHRGRRHFRPLSPQYRMGADRLGVDQ